MKKSMIVFTFACMMALTGCVGIRAPFTPPVGGVTIISAPLSSELKDVQNLPKRGSASAVNVLGLVAVGDCGLNAAMTNGGIKKAHYADYDYFNLFFFFQKTTLNVYGE